jgi:hypothetical protein
VNLKNSELKVERLTLAASTAGPELADFAGVNSFDDPATGDADCSGGVWVCGLSCALPNAANAKTHTANWKCRIVLLYPFPKA